MGAIQWVDNRDGRLHTGAWIETLRFLSGGVKSEPSHCLSGQQDRGSVAPEMGLATLPTFLHSGLEKWYLAGLISRRA